MPVYEYTCPACNLTFEKLQSIEASRALTSCPECQGAAQRAISLIARPSAGRTGVSDGGLPMFGGCGCGGACSCGHSTN